MRNTKVQKLLKSYRDAFQKNHNITQDDINSCFQELKGLRKSIRSAEKDEMFNLVDPEGNFTRVEAPRWLCHIIGLRHRAVHVLLCWQSPKLGNVFVLQVRSWIKTDSPGHLDISVGGHVVGTGNDISEVTAYREMEEEMGIVKSDLYNESLPFKHGYEFEEERIHDQFYNREWRDIYMGEIKKTHIEKITFNDNEVVGLYFCPESKASELLNQKHIPLASALKFSLPYCL